MSFNETSGPDKGGGMRKPPHIILVDDNVDMLSLFEDFMRSAIDKVGVEVEITSFKSGQALVAARERNSLPEFDLMLLDYDMPGMAGDEVCRDLRAHGYEDNIIVLLSALQGTGHKELARQAGADAYSEKVAYGRLIEQFNTFFEIARDRQLPNPPPHWLTIL
jgi:CheY-like chemotaxis protein